MPEDRPRRTHRPNEQRKNKSGWQLIAASISCVVVILLVLLFRVRRFFVEQLRRSFNKSIMKFPAGLARPIEPPRSRGDTRVRSTTMLGTNESEPKEAVAKHDNCWHR